MNLQTIKQRFGIIGNSGKLNHALQTAIQIAATELTVLIHGKSGVGKESFSKIIHNLSTRKHMGFIAINCGALPESTLYSELFGHTKNAFTGATAERKGYFETLNGGTIFLDEIGEMPKTLQQYLLRVLEQGEFVKMGSNKVETTDVRIITATNVDLLEAVKNGKFREDLYYRLNTVPIKVPSLVERKEDIALLFRKFASDFAEKYKTQAVRLDEQAQMILENYNWPGNIRELKNITEQISALSETKMINAENLIQYIPKALNRNLPALHTDSDKNDNSGYYEREILFKFLYDMKKDLGEVKKLIAELASTNNLQMPGKLSNTNFLPSYEDKFRKEEFHEFDDNRSHHEYLENEQHEQPIIIHNNQSKNQHSSYSEAEEIEETLSLEEMEKDMIKKALLKYRGKRKEAAKELGISERTLYRKIRQYELDN